jgi:hypothetical protein
MNTHAYFQLCFLQHKLILKIMLQSIDLIGWSIDLLM